MVAGRRTLGRMSGGVRCDTQSGNGGGACLFPRPHLCQSEEHNSGAAEAEVETGQPNKPLSGRAWMCAWPTLPGRLDALLTQRGWSECELPHVGKPHHCC
jgi:hypothetical protein